MRTDRSDFFFLPEFSFTISIPKPIVRQPSCYPSVFHSRMLYIGDRLLVTCDMWQVTSDSWFFLGGAAICTHRLIQCLQYAGFLVFLKDFCKLFLEILWFFYGLLVFWGNFFFKLPGLPGLLQRPNQKGAKSWPA